jgi:1,4-dihydroxy-6-naphthoate synthase
MWWPLGTRGLTGGPADAPALDPAIDTAGFAFRPVAADIQALNRRAIDRGDLDITAMSMHAVGHVRDRYALTDCGASFGDGYGPKVLTAPGRALPAAGVDHAGRATWVRGMLDRGARLAVPGLETSAYLVLRSMTGASGDRAAAEGRFVPMRFDRIVPAVLAGEVDAGLVIHEAQVTYADEGLGLIVDLGAWWEADTAGLPLPLGANAVRRDIADRFGPGLLDTVAAVLRRSIEHALHHRADGLDYAASFVTPGGAGGVGADAVDRFVGLYVNDLTTSMGERGRAGVRELVRRGEAMGLVPPGPPVDIVGGGA